MDHTVSIRFYDVQRTSEHHPSLKVVLEQIASISDLPNREKEVSPNVHIRLEDLIIDGSNHLIGEFTRIQKTNLPSEVHDDGVFPLTVGSPLGHGITFRYNHTSGLLAIQYDPRVASPSKIFMYLSAMFIDANYILKPIVRNDQWARFIAGDTRKIKISVAGATDLASIENESQPVVGAFNSLANAYSAPYITLELSMGNRKGALGSSVKQVISSFLGASVNNDLDIRSLSAVTETGDGSPNDEINFMDELLKESETLDLPDNDPQVAYEKKRNYLRQAMTQHGY